MIQKDTIISILATVPLITVFILLMNKNDKNIEFSFVLLRFCIKEELLFRFIPFQFLEKTVENCIIMGQAYAFYHYYCFNTGILVTTVYFFIGFIWALSSLRYRLIEMIQIRYLLLTLFLGNEVLLSLSL
jgi:hypothetical protein